MITIKTRPLSVNACWRGRRFKTSKYKEYEEELLWMLPKIKVPTGKIKLKIEVGFKTKLSDIDNILKPFIDILQKKYNFNDRNIYRIDITKTTGEEYISFSLNALKEK